MRPAQHSKDAHDSSSAFELRHLRPQSPTQGQGLGSASKYPGLHWTRRRRSGCGEILTGTTRSQEPLQKYIVMPFSPWTVPKQKDDLLAGKRTRRKRWVR